MPASPAARPDAIRRHNLSLVLDHIHRDGALTRAELTQRLAVSRSTVGALVADLAAHGLVQELVPSGGARVGRPSHVVGPHQSGPYVVAVDLDVTHIVVAAVGLGGSVLARRTVVTEAEKFQPKDIARIVARSVGEVSRASGRRTAPLHLGVSVPGTVDRHTGQVVVAPNLGWHDVAFGRLLAERLRGAVEVTVGNDADLAVLAEHHRGSGRDCDDLVFLMGRVGVGAGIICNGSPLHGYDGHAGEIGHNVVDASGPPCHCGKSGCVETYLGDGALLSLAGRPLPPTDEAVAAVFSDAQAGDPTALRAVRGVAEPLGRAVATLVNTLNPQRVLLGGALSGLLELARPEIERSLARYAFEAPSRSVQLLQPRFGADSALFGAAEVAFSDLLADPLAGAARLG